MPPRAQRLLHHAVIFQATCSNRPDVQADCSGSDVQLAPHLVSSRSAIMIGFRGSKRKSRVLEELFELEEVAC